MTITGYTGTETDVVIPRRINGRTVQRIGEQAFQNIVNLTSIVIPDGIRYIGGSAFEGCSNLIRAEFRHLNGNMIRFGDCSVFSSVHQDFRIVFALNAINFHAEWNGFPPLDGTPMYPTLQGDFLANTMGMINYAVQSIHLYGRIDGVIDDRFFINLTAEELRGPTAGGSFWQDGGWVHIQPYIIQSFSINGGERWRNVPSRGFDDTLLQRLLNRELTLSISDRTIDRTTRQPEAGAVIVAFDRINGRHPRPRVGVNYLVGADQTGVTPGRWVVTERGVRDSTGRPVVEVMNGRDDLEIGAADINNRNRPIPPQRWGRFFVGCNGLRVHYEVCWPAHLVYFIRVAPTSHGSIHTAASRPVRLRTRLTGREPRYMVRNNIVRVRANTGVEMGGVFTTHNERADIDVAGFVGDIRLWMNATASRPATQPRIIRIDAEGRVTYPDYDFVVWYWGW
jgi:hypothetical protein